MEPPRCAVFMEDEFLELEGNVDELLDSMTAACKGGELDSEKFVPLRVVETCSRLLKERKSVTKVAALLAELAKNGKAIRFQFNLSSIN